MYTLTTSTLEHLLCPHVHWRTYLTLSYSCIHVTHSLKYVPCAFIYVPWSPSQQSRPRLDTYALEYRHSLVSYSPLDKYRHSLATIPCQRAKTYLRSRTSAYVHAVYMLMLEHTVDHMHWLPPPPPFAEQPNKTRKRGRDRRLSKDTLSCSACHISFPQFTSNQRQTTTSSYSLRTRPAQPYNGPGLLIR